ncbi:MAG: CHAT domain-containing protein, partial [Acidobacteria bacterium]
MEAISQRYSQLSAWLGEPLRDLYLDYRSRDVELDYQMLTLLTSAIDARNFILAGDPAVRLPVDLKATASARPALGPIEVAAVPGPATTPTESVVADACALFLIEVTPSGASSVAASIPARASDVAQNAGGAGTAYRVRVSLQRPNDSGAVNFDAVVRIDLDALSAAAPDPVTYGRLLGRALLGSNPESGPDQEGGVASPVATLFAQARGLATTLNLPLRVQLAIGAGAPELHGLRWETLRDPETDTPLLAEKTVLFSRFVRSGQWRPARVRQSGDSRALVFVSNPSDLVRYRPDGDPMLVDVADEIRRVREVLAQVAVEADSNMPGSSGATADLLLRLLRDPYDILYLVAHSAIEGAEPYLYLEDESGRSQPISGLALAQLFADLEEVPQLVVLSPPAVAGAASEAEAGDRGELVRLGVCLAEAGVPAVLAMQGRVMLGTAQEFMPVFMHKFLRELRRDGLLDRAMTAARAAVIGRDDWWMPVLFLRSRTSRLFGASVPQFVAMPAPLPEGWMRTAALDRTIAALTGTNGTNLGGTGPGGLPASDWAAQTGPLARTMALSGLSGYGKSTVARAAYNDPRVAWAFPIRLWITLGPSVSPATLADGLRSWVSALGADPTAAAEVSDLSAMLRSLLASTRALLAIDDISDAGQLALFLVGGKACTHLVTTR